MQKKQFYQVKKQFYQVKNNFSNLLIVKKAVYMNELKNTGNYKFKGDLYIVLKKNKLLSMEGLQKNKISNQNINNQQRENQIDIGFNNRKHVYLARDFQQNKTSANSSNKRTGLQYPSSGGKLRKSQDKFLQNKINSNSMNPQYRINVSNCQKQLNASNQHQQYHKESLKGAFKLFSTQQKSIKSFQYKHFADFFNYVLEFKTMNKQSYISSDSSQIDLNFSHSSPSKIKKQTNSLQVHFGTNQTSSQANKNQQKKLQKLDQLSISHEKNSDNLIRNQLQNSQLSLVDVRFSTASIQDCKIQNSRKFQSDSKIQMLKRPNVFYDAQISVQIDTSLQRQNKNHRFTHIQNSTPFIGGSLSKIMTFDELKNMNQKQNKQKQQNLKHPGFYCDSCNVDPIIGKRYQCIQCKNFDLCDKCYQKDYSQLKRVMPFQSNEDLNLRQFNTQSAHRNLFPGPSLKRQMSDIDEEDNFYAEISSSTSKLGQQSNQHLQIDHVHVMQEIKKKSTNLKNIQKVLQETNRRISPIKNSRKRLLVDSDRFPSRQNIAKSMAKRQNKIRMTSPQRQKVYQSQRIIGQHPIKYKEKTEQRILKQTIQRFQELKKVTRQLKQSLS